MLLVILSSLASHCRTGHPPAAEMHHYRPVYILWFPRPSGPKQCIPCFVRLEHSMAAAYPLNCMPRLVTMGDYSCRSAGKACKHVQIPLPRSCQGPVRRPPVPVGGRIHPIPTPATQANSIHTKTCLARAAPPYHFERLRHNRARHLHCVLSHPHLRRSHRQREDHHEMQMTLRCFQTCTCHRLR